MKPAAANPIPDRAVTNADGSQLPRCDEAELAASYPGNPAVAQVIRASTRAHNFPQLARRDDVGDKSFLSSSFPPTFPADGDGGKFRPG
jgi:hypothetical protein